ncbi:hypothetical protein PN36_26585 [Candidatus Thiomargarita nelsonii]|uniref:Helix-turn-helix domain-containing protein n=1 Tax=Candidatus Thiomargarita nelsonii TaxID=1003181 RepID=A0A0A6RRX2_9GAMM|nr:hypothetical protein PN36_26585 [Candidatus Thiomargarita nelsonii]
MEKLSIREASERFGLSKARLYKLLGDGIITGELSQKRGKGGHSWVNISSLQNHLNTRVAKQRHGKGGLKIKGDTIYIPVSEAAKRIGYTVQHIHSLAKRGSIASKKTKDNKGRLIHYEDLLQYKKTLV